MYYADKIEQLKDIFGSTDVVLEADQLTVDGRAYPIIDDVIVVLDPAQYPESIRQRLGVRESGDVEYIEQIQYTFGAEWTKYPRILPSHEREFHMYFDDIVDLESLRGKRVADIGCGIGRWSYYLAPIAREVVLVDFSDAIFVARQNMREHGNALFFMGDLERLPFRDQFCDLLVCIGVLMTLKRDGIEGVRLLKRYSPRLVIYLYYALDNRPWHYRAIFKPVDLVRRGTSKIRNQKVRDVLTNVIAVGVYYPLRYVGHALRPLGWSHHVPTYEGYHNQSFERIEQDVYDRFFTSVEQRHTQAQIMSLKDTFSNVVLSQNLPYYHFLCEA